MSDRTLKTDFVNSCFRDVADRDYIAARTLFRIGLHHQFLWAALQSLEKYLKAILLYNDISAKGISHEPLVALEKSERRLPKIQPIVNDRHKNFIGEIEANGPWRYLEAPYRCMGDYLPKLDGAVWSIRRFCFQMKYLLPENDPAGEDRYSAYIEYAHQERHRDNPFGFHFMFRGYLERLLAGKAGTKQQYSNLVWKNPCFGKRRKGKIYLSASCRFQNPPHYLDIGQTPELLQWIEEKVRISKSVLDYLRNLG